METVTQLLQQHADLFTSMYREGILDDHFIQIHNILDPEDPGFLKKLADMFYQDSEKRLRDVATELQKHETNYRRIDEIVFDFKDSSNCFGTVDWSSHVIRSEPATMLITLKGTKPQWLSGELDSYKVLKNPNRQSSLLSFFQMDEIVILISVCVCLKYLEDEYFLLKRRLETFLKLEHQILAAGGTVPIIECPDNI